MYSGRHTAPLSTVGFPIRTSPGQRSVGISPEHFAATHVLLRLLAPRHPPHALSSLLTSIFSLSEAIDRGPGPCSSQQTRVLRTLLELSTYFFARLESWNGPKTCQLFEIDVLLQFSLRMHFSKNGTEPVCGADRDRTDDPRLAKPVLSQLSYSPFRRWWAWMDSNHRPYAYQAYALTT